MNQVPISFDNLHSKLLVRRSHCTWKQKSPVRYEKKKGLSNLDQFEGGPSWSTWGQVPT